MRITTAFKYICDYEYTCSIAPYCINHQHFYLLIFLLNPISLISLKRQKQLPYTIHITEFTNSTPYYCYRELKQIKKKKKKKKHVLHPRQLSFFEAALLKIKNKKNEIKKGSNILLKWSFFRICFEWNESWLLSWKNRPVAHLGNVQSGHFEVGKRGPPSSFFS